MTKPRMIEKTKNFSLVVLFISTVLLLYFFWGNISFDDLKQPDVQVNGEIPELRTIIKPDEIVINFGADNYTIVPPGESSIWFNNTDEDSMTEEIAKFAKADNILVEEITYAQYQEVMKSRSMLAEFNYDIPVSDFCLNFNISKPQSFDTVETVTSIGYSTSYKKNLFVYDGKSLKYYRMVADSDHTDFEELIATIESEGYNIYYPISTYLGVKNNNELVPLTVETNLKSFPFKQDTYSYQSDKISALAENFFGGNFDFVRKITEDKGTVIYMYGYGQTVLIVNTDGSVEYKDEQTLDNSGQSFLDALDVAVQFVAAHGSWESLGEAKLTPYLKDVITNPDKEDGYQFTFGMEVSGNLLFYQEGDPITVKVTQGQVTYYKRNLIDFDQNDIEAVETNSPQDAFSSANLIAQNCAYIYDILFQSGVVNASVDQTIMFDKVASLVNSMQIGYVKLADTEATKIQPVWVVTINDNEIAVYFDLYSAEPIGYSEE